MESVCLAEARQKVSKEQVLKDYHDVFSGLGCLPGEYCIEVDPAVPPVKNRPHRLPYKMQKTVKSGKAKVRICLDPRDLNKAVRRNHFNMPTLVDVLPELSNAEVFSMLDAKDGFLQVRLNDQSSLLGTQGQVPVA